MIADWIENWLEGRTQRVGVNGMYSDWADVTSGVPQGSGPLLFTIYINDLEERVTNKVLKFADDSKLWGKAETIQDRISLQRDLDTLGDWSIKNKMPFNVKKCKVMHIGKNDSHDEYSLMGQKLNDSCEEKDLGVFFSNNFKPNLNCDKASKSANRIIGMIKKIYN